MINTWNLTKQGKDICLFIENHSTYINTYTHMHTHIHIHTLLYI